MKYLVCPVTSQNRLIDQLCTFMSESSSLYVTTQPNLVVIGSVVVQKICVLPRDLVKRIA